MTNEQEAAIEAAVRQLVAALLAVATPHTDNRQPDHLLSVEEAARRLDIGRTTAYGMIGSGRLRSIKIGRRRVVPSGALAELIESGRSA